jgi:hypothetical protein
LKGEKGEGRRVNPFPLTPYPFTFFTR